MTSILSSISGQFSKSWILGAFFPTVVYIVLTMVFVVPLFPSDSTFLDPIKALDTQWKLVIIFLVSVLISGILYNLNIPIIRLYEGYPWKDSYIGNLCLRYWKAQFDYYHSRWIGIRTLVRAMDNTDPRYEKILGKWGKKIGEVFNNQFPGEGEFVLPTKLGNVIVSFEFYPAGQYGMDAVTLYPRLIAKVDKEYAGVIESQKTSFDFMINSSLLAAVLALSVLLIRLIYPTAITPRWMWGIVTPWLWLIEAGLFAGLAYIFYYQSIGRAKAWGSTMKGAFDLYRWNLLVQLGYQHVPKTKEEEHALWTHISQRMIYGKAPARAEPDYAPAIFVVTEPPGVVLEIARGVESHQLGAPIKIVFHLQNTDPQGREGNVTVTDVLPEGFDYEWGSASVNGNTISVTGANPYHFRIGTLPWNGKVLLQYQAIPRK